MIAALVNHLWQSTLFAALAWLVVLLLRNQSARARYWIWFAASLKFLVPFSALTWIGAQVSWRVAAARTDASQPLVETLQAVAAPVGSVGITLSTTGVSSIDWAPLLVALWLCGCVAFALRWFGRSRALASAVRAAKPVAMNLPVVVKSTARLHEPVVVGLVRPIMLLPEGIAQRLSAEQLRAIVAHELCHARHRDNLTAAIHMLVEVSFWFHPLVWWLGARLVEEREQACDEAVLAQGNEPEPYAEGILKVCRYYLESQVACAAGTSGGELKQRIEAIMSNRTVSELGSGRRAALALLAAVAVAAPFAIGLATGATPDSSVAAFDTVQIKPVDKRGTQTLVMRNGGQFQMKSLGLRTLIAFAYGVQRAVVLGGPAWLDEPLYDIDAQSDAADDAETYRAMVRGLLAKEFGVVAHTETQQPAAYVLRVDQGGAKVRPASIRPGGSGIRLEKNGDITGFRTSTKVLVDYLAMHLKQPVVDQTGLTGKYDFTLKTAFNADSLPDELKDQLGLTLELQNVSTQVVVVDQAVQPR